MTESKWTTDFSHWLNANWPAGLSAGFEVKYIKPPAKSFSLARWLEKQPHQFRNLKLCGKKLVYKISDSGEGQKCFDLFCLSEAPGYLVLRFENRKNKHFFLLETSVVDKLIANNTTLLTYNDCLGIEGMRMGVLGNKE
jgi:hypothetical protein